MHPMVLWAARNAIASRLKCDFLYRQHSGQFLLLLFIANAIEVVCGIRHGCIIFGIMECEPVKLRQERMPEALKAHAEGLLACIEAFDRTLPIERVLLFGSYARGESNPDSDVDLCVIMNGNETQQSAARSLRRAIGRIREKPALSLVPISSERLSEKRRIRDPFFETVLREGVCLAEKD